MNEEKLPNPDAVESDRTLAEVREILAGVEQRRQDRRIAALEAKLALTMDRLDQLSQQVERLSGQRAGNPGGEDGGTATPTE